MANYTNMVSTNQKRGRELETLAINAINEMVTDGEKVTVAELVKRTGCCRAYFYTNKEVAKALEIAREKQTGQIFIKPQKAILDEAIRKENELLKNKIEFLQLQIVQANKEKLAKADREFDQIAQL